MSDGPSQTTAPGGDGSASAAADSAVKTTFVAARYTVEEDDGVDPNQSLQSLNISQFDHSTLEQIEKSSRTLRDPCSTQQQLLDAMGSLRDALDYVYTNYYAFFLLHAFPAVLHVLTNTPPTFLDGQTQTTRLLGLEILRRLPLSDPVTFQHARALANCALHIMSTDNEINALEAMRLFLDVQRNATQYVEPHSLKLIELTKDLYKSFKWVVNDSLRMDSDAFPYLTQDLKALGPYVPLYAPPANGHLWLPSLGTCGESPVQVPLAASAEVSATEAGASQPHLVPGTRSLRLLAELPNAILATFKLYPELLRAHFADVANLFVQSLLAEFPVVVPSPRSIPRALREGLARIVRAHVKVLSFVAVLAKNFAEHFEPHHDTIGRAIRYLLNLCPPEASASRKELLEALQHILVAPMRTVLHAQLTELLSETVLLGPGASAANACYHLSRPPADVRAVAYQVVIELVSSCRQDRRLTVVQLARVVHITSRALHDTGLPIATHQAVVRVLCVLVDYIYQLADSPREHEKCKSLLTRILQTLTAKLETLQHIIPALVQRVIDRSTASGEESQVLAQAILNTSPPPKDALSKLKKPHLTASGSSAAGSSSAMTDGPTSESPASSSEVESSQLGSESEGQTMEAPPKFEFPLPEPLDSLLDDYVLEVQKLLYSIIFDLKAAAWALTYLGTVVPFRGADGSTGTQAFDPNTPTTAREGSAAQEEGAQGTVDRTQIVVMDETQSAVFGRIWDAGLRCLMLYAAPTVRQGVRFGAQPNVTGSTLDERTIINHFATVFGVLHPFTLRDILVNKIESLYNFLLSCSEPNLFAITDHLLAASEQVAGVYASAMLSYILTHKLQDLARPMTASRSASVAFLLLKSIINALNKGSISENYVRPYLLDLVVRCLTHAATCPFPLLYLTILRSIFRAVATGRLERLIKDLVGILPDLLQTLLRIHATTTTPGAKELCLELCFSLPARFASIVPLLPYSMRAIRAALVCKEESTIRAALRVLEFWVDKVNPDYLYSLLLDHLTDIMRALCSLLRTHHAVFGVTALQILGRLAGRARRFLAEPLTLNYVAQQETALQVRARIAPHHTVTLNLDSLLEAARSTLRNAHSTRAAFALSWGQGSHSVLAENSREQKRQSYRFLRAAILPFVDFSADIFPAFEEAIYRVRYMRGATVPTEWREKFEAVQKQLDDEKALRESAKTGKGSSSSLSSAQKLLEKRVRTQIQALTKQKGANAKLAKALLKRLRCKSVKANPEVPSKSEMLNNPEVLAALPNGVPPADLPPLSTPEASLLATGGEAPYVHAPSILGTRSHRAVLEKAALDARLRNRPVNRTFRAICASLIAAAADSDLAQDPECESVAFAFGLARHFAIVYASDANLWFNESSADSPANPNSPYDSARDPTQFFGVAEDAVFGQTDVNADMEPLQVSRDCEDDDALDGIGEHRSQTLYTDVDGTRSVPNASTKAIRERLPALLSTSLAPSLFLAACMHALANDSRDIAQAAEVLLAFFLDTIIALRGPQAASRNAAVCELLAYAYRYCHSSRGTERTAGVIVATLLCDRLPSTWSHRHLHGLISAFLNALHDTAADGTPVNLCSALAVRGLDIVVRTAIRLAQRVDAHHELVKYLKERKRLRKAERIARAMVRRASALDTVARVKAGLPPQPPLPYEIPPDVSLSDALAKSGASDPNKMDVDTGADKADSGSASPALLGTPTPLFGRESEWAASAHTALALIAAQRTLMDIQTAREQNDAHAKVLFIQDSTQRTGQATDEDAMTASLKTDTSLGRGSVSLDLDHINAQRRVTYITGEKTRRTVTIVGRVLAQNLFMLSANVVRNLVTVMANLTGLSVGDVLESCHPRIIKPLLENSLAGIPPATRIGFVAVATHCLMTEKPIVQVDDLWALVSDAKQELSEEKTRWHSFSTGGSGGALGGSTGAGSDGEPDLLTSADLPLHITADAPKALVSNNLRIESVRMLVAVWLSPTMRQAREPDPNDADRAEKLQRYRFLEQQSNDILQTLFQCLASRSQGVADTAAEGLRLIVTRERVPRDILDPCLRPLLNALGDVNKLTVPLLEALGRLLSLMSSHFNEKLGELLLSWLKTLAESDAFGSKPQPIAKSLDAMTDSAGPNSTAISGSQIPDPSTNPSSATAAPAGLDPSRFATVQASGASERQIRLVSAIYAVLPLLPPAPKLVEPIILTTLRLESLLANRPTLTCMGSPATSPFRQHLFRFLSKSDATAEATVELALKFLHFPRVAGLLQHGIRSPYAATLRRALVAGIDHVSSDVLFPHARVHRKYVEQRSLIEAEFEQQRQTNAEGAGRSSNGEPAEETNSADGTNAAEAAKIDSKASDEAKRKEKEEYVSKRLSMKWLTELTTHYELYMLQILTLLDTVTSIEPAWLNSVARPSQPGSQPIPIQQLQIPITGGAGYDAASCAPPAFDASQLSYPNLIAEEGAYWRKRGEYLGLRAHTASRASSQSSNRRRIASPTDEELYLAEERLELALRAAEDAQHPSRSPQLLIDAASTYLSVPFLPTPPALPPTPGTVRPLVTAGGPTSVYVAALALRHTGSRHLPQTTPAVLGLPPVRRRALAAQALGLSAPPRSEAAAQRLRDLRNMSRLCPGGPGLVARARDAGGLPLCLGNAVEPVAIPRSANSAPDDVARDAPSAVWHGRAVAGGGWEDDLYDETAYDLGGHFDVTHLEQLDPEGLAASQAAYYGVPVNALTPAVTPSATVVQLCRMLESNERSNRLVREEDLPVPMMMETQLLINCLTRAVVQCPDVPGILWRLLNAYAFRSIYDVQLLGRFIEVHLRTLTHAQRKQTLDEFFKLAAEPGVPQWHKTLGLRLVVNPILELLAESRIAYGNTLSSSPSLPPIFSRFHTAPATYVVEPNHSHDMFDSLYVPPIFRPLQDRAIRRMHQHIATRGQRLDDRTNIYASTAPIVAQREEPPLTFVTTPTPSTMPKDPRVVDISAPDVAGQSYLDEAHLLASGAYDEDDEDPLVLPTTVYCKCDWCLRKRERRRARLLATQIKPTELPMPGHVRKSLRRDSPAPSDDSADSAPISDTVDSASAKSGKSTPALDDVFAVRRDKLGSRTVYLQEKHARRRAREYADFMAFEKSPGEVLAGRVLLPSVQDVLQTELRALQENSKVYGYYDPSNINAEAKEWIEGHVTKRYSATSPFTAELCDLSDSDHEDSWDEEDISLSPASNDGAPSRRVTYAGIPAKPPVTKNPSGIPFASEELVLGSSYSTANPPWPTNVTSTMMNIGFAHTLVPCRPMSPEAIHEALGSNVAEALGAFVSQAPTNYGVTLEFGDQSVTGAYGPLQQASDWLVELLRAITFLAEALDSNLPPSLRQEFIRLGWRLLKHPSEAVRYTAYASVARIIDLYEAPPQIALHLYVALVRVGSIPGLGSAGSASPANTSTANLGANPAPSRALALRALQYLVPVMAARSEPVPGKYPVWIKWTRKIMVEDQLQNDSLIYIWQIIVMNPKQFYHSRHHLLMNIVPLLSRIGLAPPRPMAAKKLAFDVARLILAWDRYAILERDYVAAHPNAKLLALPAECHVSFPTPSGPVSAVARGLMKNPVARQVLRRAMDGPSGFASSSVALAVAHNLRKYYTSKSAAEAETQEVDPLSFISPDASYGVQLAQAMHRATPHPSALKPLGAEQVAVANEIVDRTVGFFVRLALLLCSTPTSRQLAKRTMVTLKSALRAWPNARVSYDHITLLMQSAPDKGAVTAYALDVINITLETMHTEWICANAQNIMSLIEQSVQHTHERIRHSLLLLAHRFVSLFPPHDENPPVPPLVATTVPMTQQQIQAHLAQPNASPLPPNPMITREMRGRALMSPTLPPEIVRFYEKLLDMIQKGITVTDMQQLGTTVTFVFIADVLSQRSTPLLDSDAIADALLNCLAVLTRSHLILVAHSTLQPFDPNGKPPPPTAADRLAAEWLVDALPRVLLMLSRRRVPLNFDQRRIYLSAVTTLIEKSDSPVITTHILTMVAEWFKHVYPLPPSVDIFGQVHPVTSLALFNPRLSPAIPLYTQNPWLGATSSLPGGHPFPMGSGPGGMGASMAPPTSVSSPATAILWNSINVSALALSVLAPLEPGSCNYSPLLLTPGSPTNAVSIPADALPSGAVGLAPAPLPLLPRGQNALTPEACFSVLRIPQKEPREQTNLLLKMWTRFRDPQDEAQVLLMLSIVYRILLYSDLAAEYHLTRAANIAKANAAQAAAQASSAAAVAAAGDSASSTTVSASSDLSALNVDPDRFGSSHVARQLAAAARPSWLSRLVRPFALGMVHRSPTIRENFTALLHKHVNANVFDRLQYIFALHEWDYHGDTQWLAQATDLLLTIIDGRTKIKLAGNPSTVMAVRDPTHGRRTMKSRQLEALLRCTKPPSARRLQAGQHELADDTMDEDSEIEDEIYASVSERDRESASRHMVLARPQEQFAMDDLDRATLSAARIITSTRYTAKTLRLTSDSVAYALRGYPASPQHPLQKPFVDEPSLDDLEPGLMPPAPEYPEFAKRVYVRTRYNPNSRAARSPIEKILLRHTRFLRAVSRLSHADHLIAAMRGMLGEDPRLACSLWPRIFPTYWALLDEHDRATLTRALNHFMAREWLQYTQFERPNMLAAMVEGIAQCPESIAPSLQPGLLRFLAHNHHAWHAAITLLLRAAEKPSIAATTPAAAALSTAPGNPAEAALSPIAAADVLLDLLNTLNERDLWAGYWKARAVSQLTRLGVSYMQHGSYVYAQEFFFLAVQRQNMYVQQQLQHQQATANAAAHAQAAAAGGPNAPHVPPPQVPAPPAYMTVIPRAETKMWEEQWIKTLQHLNQWEVLAEYASASSLPELQLECAWRLSDWAQMEDLFARYDLNESPKCQLYHVFMMLHNNHYDPGAEKTFQLYQNFAVQEWQLLPNFVSEAHLNLLHRFHRVVEVQESIHLLQQISGLRPILGAHADEAMVAPAISNLSLPSRQHMNTWRTRLPNPWDDLNYWSDIMTWRSLVYLFIQEASFPLEHSQNLAIEAGRTPYQLIEGAPTARLHDGPWTTLKLASVARKQRLPVAVHPLLARLAPYSHPSTPRSLLANLPSVATLLLETNDAFLRIRETARACMESKTTLPGSLQLLSSIDISSFPDAQRSELFRLKSDALQLHAFIDDAHQALAAATAIAVAGMPFMQNVNSQTPIASAAAAAWYSWGRLCDRIYILHTDYDHRWAEYAVVCYLQAIVYGGGPRYTSVAVSSLSDPVNQVPVIVPRILWLVHLDSIAKAKDQLKAVYNDAYKTVNKQVSQAQSDQQGDAMTAGGVNDSTASAAGNAAPAEVARHMAIRASDQIFSNPSTLPLVLQALQTTWELCPESTWVPWIPYLTASLPRLEGAVFKDILIRIVDAYPQALYYTLRSHFIERRELASHQPVIDLRRKAHGENAESLTWSSQYANDIMAAFRRLSLFNEIERLSDEIARRLRNDPYEDLLLPICTLLHKCYKPAITKGDRVPFSVAAALERTLARFFDPSLLYAQPVNPKRVTFATKFKAAFERDFLQPSFAPLLRNEQHEYFQRLLKQQLQQHQAVHGPNSQPPLDPKLQAALPTAGLPPAPPPLIQYHRAVKAYEDRVQSLPPHLQHTVPLPPSLVQFAANWSPHASNHTMARTLTELIDRLRAWRDHLLWRILCREHDLSVLVNPSSSTTPEGAAPQSDEVMDHLTASLGEHSLGGLSPAEKAKLLARAARQKKRLRESAARNKISGLNMTKPDVESPEDDLLDETSNGAEMSFADEYLELPKGLRSRRTRMHNIMDQIDREVLSRNKERVQRQNQTWVAGENEAEVDSFFPQTQYLERCAPYLWRYRSTVVEVPGQYQTQDLPGQSGPAVRSHVIAMSIDPCVHISVSEMSGVVMRHITFNGSDGRPYSFAFTLSTTNVVRTDERMTQVIVLLNRIIGGSLGGNMPNYAGSDITPVFASPLSSTGLGEKGYSQLPTGGATEGCSTATARNKEARRRNLAYHVPVSVPLTHRAHLTRSHSSIRPFDQIYSIWCRSVGPEYNSPGTEPLSCPSSAATSTPFPNSPASILLNAGRSPNPEAPHGRSRDIDLPLLLYRSMMRRALGTRDTRDRVSDEEEQKAQLVWHDYVCKHILPETIFSRFFHKTIPALDQLWSFRKEFATQIALTGYLGYLLKINERAPQKIGVFAHSGKIFCRDFTPSYNEMYLLDHLPTRTTTLAIERDLVKAAIETARTQGTPVDPSLLAAQPLERERVDFRLTRNVTAFLGPFMVDGVVAAAVTAATGCLNSQADAIRNQLSLFLRDDLLQAAQLYQKPYKPAESLAPHVMWAYPQMSDVAQRRVEYELLDRVNENADAVLKRIQALLPTSNDARRPLDHNVDSLLALQMDKTNIAMMPPTWFPAL